MTYDYDQETCGWFFSAKETAFRTNAAEKDTTNGATYVYYRFPIRDVKWTLVFMKRGKIVRQQAGVGPDIGEILRGGYDVGKVTLEGELVEFSLLYFLCKACTTADNTPAGFYTHTYVNTTARGTGVSFQIFNKHLNDAGANTILNLLVGAIVKKITVSGSQNQLLHCAIEIQFANIVAGTALTAPGYPVQSSLRSLEFGDAVITFTKGGVAYDAKALSWEWTVDDGCELHKCSGEAKPEEYLRLPRRCLFKAVWLPKTLALLTDMWDDEPDETDDVDLTLKISRNTTSDYIQCAWAKAYPIEAPLSLSYSYHNAKLVAPITYAAKPAWQETGATWTITEVNSLDDDRYET
jgi:hypothetical protein